MEMLVNNSSMAQTAGAFCIGIIGAYMFSFWIEKPKNTLQYFARLLSVGFVSVILYIGYGMAGFWLGIDCPIIIVIISVFLAAVTLAFIFFLLLLNTLSVIFRRLTHTGMGCDHWNPN